MSEALVAQMIEMVKELKLSNRALQAEQTAQQSRQDKQMKPLTEMVQDKGSSSSGTVIEMHRVGKPDVLKGTKEETMSAWLDHVVDLVAASKCRSADAMGETTRRCSHCHDGRGR